MGDWPNLLPLIGDHTCINNFGLLSPLVGAAALTQGIGTLPANLIHYTPVRIPEIVTVCKLAVGSEQGSTGNFDAGIYDSEGNKLVSTGSTAKSAGGSERIVDVTDTVLLPGLYYFAFVADTVASGMQSFIGTQFLASFGAATARLCGLLEQAGTFPLPAAATFASCTTAVSGVISVAAYLRGE